MKADKNQGTSKGSFFLEGFVPDYTYFKYYDEENNRYDFYDYRTNLRISSVETAFFQAEARFLQALSIMPNRKISDLIRRNQPLIKQLLKCHGILGNLLDYVNQKETVLEALQQELTLFQKENVPLLYIEFEQKPSALGSAIQTDAKRCVKMLLDIFNQFQDHFVTGLTIDKNLLELIINNYDVKELLENEILLINLNDCQELPLFVTESGIVYNACHLNKPQSKISELENFDKNCWGHKRYTCEYKSTCLRNTFSRLNFFFEALKYYNNLEIFENEMIQLLIDYYWSDEIVSQLKKKFKIYLAFLVLLIFNVLDSAFNKSTDENQIVTDNRIGWLVTCQTLIICLYNTYYLINWIMDLKDKGYINKEMRLNLIFILIIYPIVILNNFSEINEGLIPFQILMLVFGFYKLNSHLQIFEQFSFMISMFYEAFIDLKFFVAFFVLIIVEFGLLFLLAFKGSSKEQYEGLSIFGGYMMMAFRLSTGDFELDAYKDQNQFFILVAWGIWIVSVLALNMIFLNFIIAVISSTFDKVMQNQLSQQYRKKVEFITQANDYGCFIIRKPIQVSDQQQSWNGFVKDIKKEVQISSQKTQKRIDFRLKECHEIMSTSYNDIQSSYQCEKENILNEIDEIQKLIQQL
eukprot:403348497